MHRDSDIRDSANRVTPQGITSSSRPRRRAIVVAAFVCLAGVALATAGCGGDGGDVAGGDPSGSDAGAAPGTASTERRRLTDDPGADRSPRFSPDGRWLVFESDRGRNWSLWLLDLEGGGAPVRLTDDAGTDRHPAWAPDGRRIAFQSNRDRRHGLYTIDLGAETVSTLVGPPRLLFEDDSGELLPDWSPDGGSIAVTSVREDDSAAPTVHLWMFPVDGDGAPRRVTEGLGGGVAGRFSPDARRIAYHSRRDTEGEDDEIYVLDLGIRDLTRITRRPGHDFVPAWSPDGERLAVATVAELDDGTTHRAITLYDLAGTPLARVGEGFDRVTLPDWSPDGRWIAYAGRTDVNYDIWVQRVPVSR